MGSIDHILEGKASVREGNRVTFVLKVISGGFSTLDNRVLMDDVSLTVGERHEEEMVIDGGVAELLTSFVISTQGKDVESSRDGLLDGLASDLETNDLMRAGSVEEFSKALRQASARTFQGVLDTLADDRETVDGFR